MIITCEKCDTRFRLDDARIPDQGARVRCSRCKHAFHVQRPGIAMDDALAEVVAEATHPGALSAPQANHDLPGPGETNPGLTSSLETLESGNFDEEQDWEFNLDPPGGAAKPAAGAAPPPAAAQATAALPAPNPHSDPVGEAIARGVGEASPLDELGSPSEWDFLTDAGAGPGPESASTPATEEQPADAAPIEAPAMDAAAGTGTEPASSKRTERSRASVGAARSASPIEWARPATGPAAVALVAAMLVFGAVLSLRPAGTAAPVSEPPTRFELAAGSATGVVQRHVENALAGPLIVVTGDFEVSGHADRGLQVQWVDAAGEPIGGIGIAGPPVAAGMLRERAPEILQQHLVRNAAGLSRGGAFQAILGPKPPGAVRFQVVASAQRFQTPAPSEVEVGDELEAAAATAARLPSPLPSSE